MKKVKSLYWSTRVKHKLYSKPIHRIFGNNVLNQIHRGINHIKNEYRGRSLPYPFSIFICDCEVKCLMTVDGPVIAREEEKE